MKITPHNYQTRCLKHCIENKIAALFLDMGLGKSVIILTLINYLLNSKQIRGALILAPLRVVYNVWPDEIQKWDHLRHRSFTILHGKGKKELSNKKDIYIINYDGLPWLYDELQKYKRDKFPFDMIVFDESTAIKNPKTKRFKYLRNLIKAFPRRIILTGTPAPNSLEDLWAQYFLLDLGERLGRSKNGFRLRYFYPTDYNQYKWVPRPGSVQALSEKVQDVTIRLSAKDYLEMPKLITNEIIWSMSDKIQNQYRKFEKNFLTEIENEVITAVNAASLSIKLRQFLSGFLYSESGPIQAHKEKLDVLEEFLSEQSEPVLVAIQFRFEYEMIEKLYPKVPIIYGGISPLVAKAHIKQWNEGSCPILLLHPASVAHGINLQEGGRILLWYSLPWSFEHYTQLKSRIYRQGQTKPVICHHLIAKRTVEEKVVQALLDKRNTEKSFMKSLILKLKGNDELPNENPYTGDLK